MNSLPVGRSRRLALTAVMLLGGLAVSGCGDTRKALGFDKNLPDEFKVVNRAPLEPAPRLRSAPAAARRQPAAGAELPEQARQVLIGGAARARPPPTPASAPARRPCWPRLVPTRSDPPDPGDRGPRFGRPGRRGPHLPRPDRLLEEARPAGDGGRSAGGGPAPAREPGARQAGDDGDTPIIRRRKKGAAGRHLLAALGAAQRRL